MRSAQGLLSCESRAGLTWPTLPSGWRLNTRSLLPRRRTFFELSRFVTRGLNYFCQWVFLVPVIVVRFPVIVAAAEIAIHNLRRRRQSGRTATVWSSARTASTVCRALDARPFDAARYDRAAVPSLPRFHPAPDTHTEINPAPDRRELAMDEAGTTR